MVPCPYCGEKIKRKAKACPHCGSDERTGWSEDTYMDGIDLEDDFDYEELLNKEFPSKKHSVKSQISWKTIVAIIMLILFMIIVLRNLT